MQLDIENARRFSEEPAIQAVSSEDDIILTCLANGTGVKAIKLSALKLFFAGDITDLDTVDKTSLVAAANEIFGDVSILKARTALLTFNCAGLHNSIYRGKDVTEYLTDGTLWKRINGSDGFGLFEDLWIGDTITVSSKVYRIAAFDYWLHCGDTECTTHHIVLVPDANMYSAKMNDSNITTGGYVGSKMYTTYIADAKTTIDSAFGSAHILNHRALLTNAIASDKASGWAWYDSTVDLMNEPMVYGHNAWGAHHGYETAADKGQLPLFALEPSRICNRANWWLRDVYSGTAFASVADNGNASYGGASNSDGVRPAFGIKA